MASPSGLALRDGYLWLASLRGQRLWRIDVTGRLWVTTRNRDGRGFPARVDDRILLVDAG